MKCGFYEFDITPALGSIIPGGFAARFSTEVQEPLYARAFVAETQEKALAVVVIDACGITQDITDRIRERVAKFTPILPENVLVMATHCHGGGPTLNWGEEVVTDPAYLDFLVNRAADAVTTAWQRAKESELVSGKEELYGVSFIRVYKMKDGSFKTNPSRKKPEDIVEPQTTIDPEVLVIGVKQEGKPVGAIVNFANHPAIVANTKISSDFVYSLSQEMKQEYGQEFVTLFVNGACGNVNHINPYDETTLLPGRQTVIGKEIAGKAIAALSNAQPMKEAVLQSASKTITVHFRKPDEKALAEAKEVFASYGDDLINHVPGTPKYRPVFFALQAFRIMADKRTERSMELQLFRLGDVYLAGTPTQMFTQFGKRIKEKMPGACLVSIFSNDYCGYVPTPELIGEKGVYEAQLCPTSALEPATGDKVVEGILSLVKDLK